MMGVQVINALNRAVCWTSGMMDGMVTVVAGAFWRDRNRDAGLVARSLEPLRTALLGRHRRQIERALGTPPAVWDGLHAPRSHWEAMTWYYPCDEIEKRAIAIRFVNDRAQKVEVIRGPG
jgi:hypothetical protein